MIIPIEELTKNKYSRYTLVMATAKCARILSEAKEAAESDKSENAAKIKLEEKNVVGEAMERLYDGEFSIRD